MSTTRSGADGSYWHATAAPIVPDDSLPATSEVVVVGGGLLGCWTAYWLARAGVEVTLIERTAIGWGATGRNGGFLGHGAAMGYEDAIAWFGHSEARSLWQLSHDGGLLARQVIAEEGIDCDLRNPGILSLALSDDELSAFRRSADLMRADGFPAECLDRTAAQEHVGAPLAPEITGAVFAANDGLLHSTRYLTGIAEAARRRGARLCHGDVTALVPLGNGTRVETTAGQIAARHVAVALNAWSDQLLPDVAGLIVPTRGQILAYEPIPPVFGTGMAASVTPTGEYWQQTPDGTIVIGGCRADNPHGDLGVRDLTPTDAGITAIEAVLPRLFPKLAGLRVARRWAGPMAFTSDYLPIADRAPNLSNVWFTGGYCGHGMPFGPRVGQLLAEAVMTGRRPEPLAPLRIDRPTLVPLTVPA